MPISISGQLDDVDNGSYVSANVPVSTSQVQAKVGASNLTGRQTLIIENTGSADIYVGPSGLTAGPTGTGIKIAKNGGNIALPYGDNINVFMLTLSGSTTVVVQEAG